MIIKSKSLGRILIVKENTSWFGYGLDEKENICGCISIAPPTCKHLYDVFIFIKENICRDVVIERRV